MISEAAQQPSARRRIKHHRRDVSITDCLQPVIKEDEHPSDAPTMEGILELEKSIDDVDE